MHRFHVKIFVKMIVPVSADNSGQPASRWYTGAGIYRHVRLLAMDPVHFPRWATFIMTPHIGPTRAAVRVQGTIANRSETSREIVLRIEIISSAGQAAAALAGGKCHPHSAQSSGAGYVNLELADVLCNMKIKTAIAPTHPGCPAKTDTPKTDASENESKRGGHPRNYSWAQLLKRVFELDLLACPRCGGKMKVLCAINSQPAIQKILACLGLPSRAPPVAPARPDVERELF